MLKLLPIDDVDDEEEKMVSNKTQIHKKNNHYFPRLITSIPNPYLPPKFFFLPALC